MVHLSYSHQLAAERGKLRKIRGSVAWMEVNDAGNDCGICMQPLGNIARRGNLECCEHIFCLGCISRFVSTNDLACPTCKKQFSKVYEIDDEGEHVQTIEYQSGCRTLPPSSQQTGSHLYHRRRWYWVRFQSWERDLAQSVMLLSQLLCSLIWETTPNIFEPAESKIPTDQSIDSVSFGPGEGVGAFQNPDIVGSNPHLTVGAWGKAICLTEKAVFFHQFTSSSLCLLPIFLLAWSCFPSSRFSCKLHSKLSFLEFQRMTHGPMFQE